MVNRMKISGFKRVARLTCPLKGQFFFFFAMLNQPIWSWHAIYNHAYVPQGSWAYDDF